MIPKPPALQEAAWKIGELRLYYLNARGRLQKLLALCSGRVKLAALRTAGRTSEGISPEVSKLRCARRAHPGACRICVRLWGISAW